MTLAASPKGQLLLKLLAVVILLGLVAAVFFSPVGEALDMDSIELWIEQGRAFADNWWAPIAFIGLVTVATTLPVPASMFVVVSAVLWGWGEGGLYTLIGCLLASWVSFELARWVVGGAVVRFLGKRFPKLGGVLDRASIHSVAVMRLVPGLPFFVFNYGSGVTSMRLRSFLIGSAIGLPISVYVIAFSADAIVTGALGQGDLVSRLILVSVIAALAISLPVILRRRFSVVRELESTVSRSDSL